MKFISTRGYSDKFDSAQVIKMGIAPDGGLFVPESIPVLTQDDINQMLSELADEWEGEIKDTITQIETMLTEVKEAFDE